MEQLIEKIDNILKSLNEEELQRVYAMLRGLQTFMPKPDTEEPSLPQIDSAYKSVDDYLLKRSMEIKVII